MNNKLIAAAIIIKARSERERQELIKKVQSDPLYLAMRKELEAKQLNKN